MTASSDRNLFHAFQAQFRRRAERVALTASDGTAVTYQDLDRVSAQIANMLTARGLRPGDRVSVQVAKSVPALGLYLACLRGGFVYHPLNTGYQRQELEFFLADAAPKLIVCDEPDESLMRELGRGTNPASVKEVEVLTLNQDGSGTLVAEAQLAESDHQPFAGGGDDVAALLYSSGTTGRPKGIPLTHENLLSNAETLVAYWGFTDADVLLHALPVYHVHGLFVALGCVFLSGASMRWHSGFAVDRVLDELPLCTVMMGVPTYYTRLLADSRFDRKTCANLRLLISGSAPLLSETFEAVAERTGHRILERYGMSEAGMISSNPLEGERLAGTVGFPLPGVELRVVDEQGEPCAVGCTGNVEVRGSNVFSGYWNRPEKTAEDFRPDGFFATGDLGRLDEEGRLTIAGRSKDLIISGGLNVYPREIELELDLLPGVNESAVIGVPHSDFGEAVLALVVMLPSHSMDEAAMLTELKTRLAGFKVPKRVLPIEELPRNAMGKVQKSKLRERYAEMPSGG